MDEKQYSMFIYGAFQVLKELLGQEPLQQSTVEADEMRSNGGYCIMIGIAGSLQGRFILKLEDNDTLINFSQMILQEEVNLGQTELVESAVSELGNLICGRGISLLSEIGIKLKISPPAIFEGADVTFYGYKGPMYLTTFKSGKGNIVISLAFQKLSQFS